MYNISTTSGSTTGAIPVFAGVVIAVGGLFGVNATGYAVPIAAAGVAKVVGRAESDADNTDGANGDLYVHGKRDCMHLLNSEADPLTMADFGADVYAESPDTVRKGQSDAEAIAGVFVGFDPEGNCMVDVRRA